MKMKMFQFIFFSMTFHYGVKINRYKTTGITEKKLGVVAPPVQHLAQSAHTTHTSHTDLG